MSGTSLTRRLNTHDGEFGAFETAVVDRLFARASEFFVLLMGREPQRVTNQVHHVRLSALFRVIE